MCSLLRLAFLTQHVASEIHPGAAVPLPCCMVFHAMNSPQFIHLPVQEHLSFEVLLNMIRAAVDMHMQVLL